MDEKSINEVDGLLKEDDSKQVFYFDDFLGHTKLEIENAKTNEKGLLHFIKRIRKSPNKYIVLTTRTSLLNEASIESERFRNSDIISGKFEIEVKEFHLNEKIEMVENHFHVNKVLYNYLECISKIKIAQIARHQIFFPRLLEFVTKQNNYEVIPAEKYYEYIIDQLNNPKEIWFHAYTKQINDYDRFFLTTLFSFGDAIEPEFMEEAFELRLQYEIEVNKVARTNDEYYSSAKKLLGSFIKIYNPHGKEKFQFIDPSVEDFLNHYLSNNTNEKLRIINSFLFIEQIIKKFRHADLNYLIATPKEFFYNRLSNAKFKTIASFCEDRVSYINLYLAFITWMFYKDKKGIDLCIIYLKNVDYRFLRNVNFYHLFGFVKIGHLEPTFKNFLTHHFNHIALYLIANCPEILYLEEIKELFKSYEVNYSKFIINDTNHDIVKECVDNYYATDISDEVENLKAYNTYEDVVWSSYNSFKRKKEHAYRTMEIYDNVTIEDFEDLNWEAICFNNQMEEMMKKDN